MGYDVYKNDTLPSGNFTDLAGNTRTYPYGGESRVGVDLFTGAELVIADENENNKLKGAVKNYLIDSPDMKVDRIIDRDDLPDEALSGVAAKSILYSISGDKKGSDDVVNSVPSPDKRKKLQELTTQ